MKKNFKYWIFKDLYLNISHSLPGNYLTAGEMRDEKIVLRPRLITHCTVLLVPEIQIFDAPFYKGLNLSWLIFHLTISKKVKDVKDNGVFETTA